MSDTIKTMYCGDDSVIVDTEVTDIEAYKALGYSFEKQSEKKPAQKKATRAKVK